MLVNIPNTPSTVSVSEAGPVKLAVALSAVVDPLLPSRGMAKSDFVPLLSSVLRQVV